MEGFMTQPAQPIAAPVNQQPPAQAAAATPHQETPLSVMESEANAIAQLFIMASGTLTAVSMAINPIGGLLFASAAYLTGKLTNLLANMCCVDSENTAIKVGKYVLTFLASIGVAVALTTAIGIVPLSFASIVMLSLATLGPFVMLDIGRRAGEYFFGPRCPEPIARSYNPWQATFIPTKA
jgi:hypothetical protein